MEPNSIDLGPTIRLAIGGPQYVINKAFIKPREDEDLPNVLCSYWYLDKLFENRKSLFFEDWVMDSGAFSAKNSGTHIELDEYTECCRRLLKEDPSLSEVYALDVIGDADSSMANCEKMWKGGVPAIPTFHFGSDFKRLTEMAREYPKIALGGAVGMVSPRRLKWARYCFSLVWKAVGPMKIHGFGFGAESLAIGCPFHSTDATTWEYGPLRFGRWPTFGVLPTKGGKQNLRKEILSTMKLQRKARGRWRREMEKISDNTYERFGLFDLGDTL